MAKKPTGRLSTLPSRIGVAPQRIGQAPRRDHEGKPARYREEAHWRAWYKTARWRALRQEVLIRDGYTCQRTGQVCAGKYPDPNSPTVNHKRPHRGDPALFWDITNLEVVAKSVHDSAIQKEEQATRHQVGVWS